ncbi:MAG: hypothetical protein ABIU20_10795 [Blastocatellia bacterium]
MDIDSFLLEDYKQKVAYLTAHFGRMWNRFNYFVVLESALTGFLLNNKLWNNAVYFALTEMLLSLIWWSLGAQDRFLVKLYRDAVKDAVERIKKRLPAGQAILEGDYRYVGETGEELAAQSKYPFEWYSIKFSVTKLAAIIPFILFLGWSAAFLVLLYFKLFG